MRRDFILLPGTGFRAAFRDGATQVRHSRHQFIQLLLQLADFLVLADDDSIELFNRIVEKSHAAFQFFHARLVCGAQAFTGSNAAFDFRISV
jgi:hypothetical protein